MMCTGTLLILVRIWGHFCEKWDICEISIFLLFSACNPAKSNLPDQIMFTLVYRDAIDFGADLGSFFL